MVTTAGQQPAGSVVRREHRTAAGVLTTVLSDAGDVHPAWRGHTSAAGDNASGQEGSQMCGVCNP
jgi:hypothetical protein